MKILTDLPHSSFVHCIYISCCQTDDWKEKEENSGKKRKPSGHKPQLFHQGMKEAQKILSILTTSLRSF